MMTIGMVNVLRIFNMYFLYLTAKTITLKPFTMLKAYNNQLHNTAVRRVMYGMWNYVHT